MSVDTAPHQPLPVYGFGHLHHRVEVAAEDERLLAATRARQLVPLAAMLHSFMIAHRVISAAITREAGHGAQARGAASALTALTFDYNIAVTTAMADAYVGAVQGDLADLDWARRVLIDVLLADEAERQTFVVSLGSELLAILDARRHREGPVHTPNSVRYRLRQIAQLTGHDPHHLTDLLELHSAARILSNARR